MENYKIKLKEISKKFGPDESIAQCLNYPERTNEFIQKSKKLNLKYNGGTTLFGLMIIILGCLPDRPIEQRFLIVVGLTFFLFFIIEFRRCQKINRAIECAYNDKNNYPYGRITSPSKVMPPENSTSK